MSTDLGQQIIDDAQEHSIDPEQNQEIIADSEDFGTDAGLEEAPADEADSADDETDEDANKDENDKDEKSEAENKNDDPEHDQDANEKDSQISDLQTKLEKAEKRFHDNQSSYTRSQQENSELKKEISELKDRLSELEGKTSNSSDTDDKDWFDDNEEENADPEKDKANKPVVDEETNERIAALEEKTRQDEEARALAAWNEAEAPVKEKHDDYKKMVNEILEPELEKNPVLFEAFKEKGGTPEVAYEMGLALFAARNPEEYKEKLRIELENEKKESPKRKIPLSPNSQNPSGNAADSGDDDLIGEALGKR